MRAHMPVGVMMLAKQVAWHILFYSTVLRIVDHPVI